MIYTARESFMDRFKGKHLDYWVIFFAGSCFGMFLFRIAFVHAIVKACDDDNWFTVKSGTTIECAVIEKGGHPWIPDED